MGATTDILLIFFTPNADDDLKCEYIDSSLSRVKTASKDYL